MSVRSINSDLTNQGVITTTKTKIEYPISLSVAKRHLRVEDAFVEDDDMIEDIIEDATEYIEDAIQKDIAKTLNVSQLWDFNSDFDRIYEADYHSMVSIITDSSASLTAEQILPYSNYFSIELSTSVTSDPLTVTYYTGYFPEENTIPKSLRRAILIKIGDLYDVERQGYNVNAIKSNEAVDRLIAKYKSTIF